MTNVVLTHLSSPKYALTPCFPSNKAFSESIINPWNGENGFLHSTTLASVFPVFLDLYTMSKVNPVSIPFKNGVKHGSSLYLRLDGTAIESIEYSGGQRNGYSYIYHKDGITLAELNHYVNDELHGVCKRFNEKGELVSKELYIRNELIRKAEFKRS